MLIRPKPHNTSNRGAIQSYEVMNMDDGCALLSLYRSFSGEKINPNKNILVWHKPRILAEESPIISLAQMDRQLGPMVRNLLLLCLEFPTADNGYRLSKRLSL